MSLTKRQMDMRDGHRVLLFCYIVEEHLEFLGLGSDATLLPQGDDFSSDAIGIPGGFPFGRVIQNTTYVSCSSLLCRYQGD